MTKEIESAAVVVGPKTHLFLSPHYDDIALSCGGTGALATDAGDDGIVALLFGDYPDPIQPLTDFAAQMHTQWGMPTDDVIDARRAEEAVASRILGLHDLYLPFRDAIYRGDAYLNDDDLFGIVAEQDETLPIRIVAELERYGFTEAETRGYAPLASGNHVDHQLAFRVGEILHRAGWDIWFYEDLPYSLLEGRVAARIEQIEVSMEIGAIVDISSVWSRKIDAIMAYPSQLKVIFADYVGAGDDRASIEAVMHAYSSEEHGRTVERFWRIAN